METALLLHGAIGAAAQLQPIADILSETYEVHMPDFPGHGGTPLPAEPFSVSFFAHYIVTYIEQHKLPAVTVFGYSMGGYVALYLARHYPQLINRVITLGTKFYWDEATAAKETAMLVPEVIEAKVPAFAASLKILHTPENWKEVLLRTAAMLQEMGKNNPLQPEALSQIVTPALLMVGDRDKMVSVDETIGVYHVLPDAQLAVLPATVHAIERVKPLLVKAFVNC